MSLDTIIRVEDTLGMGIMKIGQKLSEADLSMSQIIAIITLAIRGGGNQVKEKDVKLLVAEIGLVEAIKMCGELVTLALSVDEDTEEKKSEQD
tara:strand:+ start:546 stop:824 length:279 start_codon:yes stop_codon:yes gene_type:complete